MELVLMNVSKQYGNKKVVDNISISLHQGVIGLLGANGAGKTTLMRMICGILKPTTGSISLDETDVSEEMYRDVLGYLPQDFGYYPNFTGRDFLMYMSALKGIDKSKAKRKCDELLKVVNLENAADKKIKTYSGGMRQRLGIAQAIMENPDILILDEPFNGLDKNGVADMRALLLQLKQDGKTIIMASHSSDDINVLCDEVYEMDAGKLIF